MKFVNYVKYIGDQDKVAAFRSAHREYARRLINEGKLVLAGPLADGIGALFIYEAETRQEAEALLANDPFAKGGVLESYELSTWQLLGVDHDLLQRGERLS